MTYQTYFHARIQSCLSVRLTVTVLQKIIGTNLNTELTVCLENLPDAAINLWMI